MKFLIVFLAFVALGSTRTLFERQKEIKVDSDSIVIRSPLKTIVIEKASDDTGIQIMAKNQDGVTRRLNIDKDFTVKELNFLNENDFPSELSDEDETIGVRDLLGNKGTGFIKMQVQNDQMTVLVNICGKYERVVDGTTFRELLQEIKRAVDRNDLHPVLFEIIKDLERENTIYTPTPIGRWSPNTKDPRMDWWKTRKQDSFDEVSDLYKIRDQQQFMDNFDTLKLYDLEDMTSDMKDLLESMEDFGLSTDVQKQFRIQMNIQEIQGYIMNYQLQAKQLQLNQQFVNTMKHHIQMQIMTGLQRGLHFMQMQKLYQAKGLLLQKEKELMVKQMNLQVRILKLQRDLVRQEQFLHQSLVGEERITMVTDDDVLERMMKLNDI